MKIEELIRHLSTYAKAYPGAEVLTVREAMELGSPVEFCIQSWDDESDAVVIRIG
jgi:hypothetical protein